MDQGVRIVDISRHVRWLVDWETKIKSLRMTIVRDVRSSGLIELRLDVPDPITPSRHTARYFDAMIA